MVTKELCDHGPSYGEGAGASVVCNRVKCDSRDGKFTPQLQQFLCFYWAGEGASHASLAEPRRKLGGQEISQGHDKEIDK